MKLKKILWKYDPHQDGTCDIKIYVYYQKKQRNISTGYSVLPQDWDEKSKEVKKTHPFARQYNTNIRNLLIELEDHLINGGTVANFRKQEEQINLITYCAQVIQKADDGLLPLTQSTVANYRATHRRLTEYAEHYPDPPLTFDKIDMQFYQQFTGFLKKHCNCSLPGIGKHIKIIKRLMNMGLEENLHNNTTFRNSAFKRPRAKSSGKIYLTTEEIDKLEQLDLSSQPVLERERDRFLLAYWLLMRFSDVSRVGREQIFDLNGKQFLRYQSMKTKVEATLPLKYSALAIMEKHEFDFSFSGNVQANRQLKTIAAMAGINTQATQDGQNRSKSSFVTTHTARRSAATNLYLDGVSLKMIADLGGWSDLKSLRTYLRASGLDTAQVAKDLDFFN